ncbi:MAG: hypothetical protein GY778_18585 [bacterium]|nr:hypothetical protein [bacterium]
MCWRGFVAVLTVAASLSGCGAPAGLSGTAADNDGSAGESPDAATLLEAAYDAEGDARTVVFVDVDGATADELNDVMVALAETVDAEILPSEVAFRGDPDLPALTPIDPETGQVGVSLTLRGITRLGDDEYEATVSFARSGLDGGELVLVVAREEDGWAVVDQSHASTG